MRCVGADPFAVQPNTEDYSRVPIDLGKLFFDIYHNAISNSQTRIPGYFVMVGGPAFGPNAMTKAIKYFGWQKVASYYQNDPQDVITADTFASLALSEGITLALQKRESATQAGKEQDYQDLLKTETNIFIFFGGSDGLPCRWA